MRSGSVLNSFSPLLLPSHLGPMLQHGFSVGHSPFRGAVALPWTYQWTRGSSGNYLLCHTAPPCPLTLLSSLFFCPPTHSLVLSMFPPSQNFLPFLKCVFLEVPWTWLMGSAAWGPLQRQLEVAVSDTGQPLAFSHRGHSWRLSPAKTLLFTSSVASKGWALVP